MNGIYENFPSIIDSKKINDTIDFINEIFSLFKEKVLGIKTKKEEKRNLESEEEVKKLISLMDETLESIEKNPLLNENEYIYFYELKTMTEYLLKDMDLFSEHYNLILDCSNLYTSIIFTKFQNDICEDNEEYEQLVYSFNRKLEFFYGNIYKHLGIYDDLIDDFVNTLEGDPDEFISRH